MANMEGSLDANVYQLGGRVYLLFRDYEDHIYIVILEGESGSIFVHIVATSVMVAVPVSVWHRVAGRRGSAAGSLGPSDFFCRSGFVEGCGARRMPLAASGSLGVYSCLDPTVVQSARQARVSKQYLAEMARLTSLRQGVLKDAPWLEAPRGSKVDVGEELETVEIPGKEAEAGEAGSDPVTSIVDHLPGRARRAASKRSSNAPGPAAESSSCGVRGWVEHRSRIPNIPSSVRMS